MSKTFYLIHDSGLTKSEINAATSILENATTNFYPNRQFEYLGNKLILNKKEINLDKIVDKATTKRKTGYGAQKDAWDIHYSLMNSQWHWDNPGIVIFLTSQDITVKMNGRHLGSCFGFTLGDCIIISVKRFNSLKRRDREILIKGTILHELGHVFHVTGNGQRPNTKKISGWHCTNHGCVMQQATTRSEFLAVFKSAQLTTTPYCADCMNMIYKTNQ